MGPVLGRRWSALDSAAAAAMMMVVTPMMMVVMVALTAPMLTPLRLLLALFSRRPLYETLQRHPLFLTEALQNLLNVRHPAYHPFGLSNLLAATPSFNCCFHHRC
jgi:hypothetical protein